MLQIVSDSQHLGSVWKSVVIPIGASCAPLLADLFFYSFEAEFIQKLVDEKINHSL